MWMKINFCLMLIVLLSPVVLYRVAAESKVIDGTFDTKAKGNGNDSVNPTVKHVKDGKDVHVSGNASIKQPELTEGVNGEQKNTNGTVSNDDQKQNKGFDSKPDKGTEKVKHPVCDSSSNRCTDDDKTLVACLRVPGNAQYTCQRCRIWPIHCAHNLARQTNFIAILFLGALAMTASVLLCLFLRRRFAERPLKYQMLDMELPVSHGREQEPAPNESWDDSWGDNWDDEEAPITPSFPVTPNHSAKGIASRKYNKVGWKD